MKKLVAVTTLVVFLFLGGFGMLFMTGMDGHHHEPGCPFMPGEKVICTMTALDHIGAWQSTFSITIPTLFIYLLLSVAVLFVFKFFQPPDLFVRRSLPIYGGEPQVIPLYQELFSSGILHPKAP